MVPVSFSRGTPRSFATATNMAKRTADWELETKFILISSREIPSIRLRMSSMESMATPPQLPTSPSARGSSESLPMMVGISRQRLIPVAPISRSCLILSFALEGESKEPNCRIVHGL